MFSFFFDAGKPTTPQKKTRKERGLPSLFVSAVSVILRNHGVGENLKNIALLIDRPNW